MRHYTRFSGLSSVCSVHFVGKFLDQDVPNLTVGAGSTASVSVSYEGDLQNGVNAQAFQEAFRSPGVQAITTIPGSDVFYHNGLSAISQPNLLHDVGAFSNGSAPVPGQLTDAEALAGISVAPPREVVRAHFKATASGTFTFVPDVTELFVSRQFDAALR